MTEREFKLIQDCLEQASGYTIHGRRFIDKDNALIFIYNLVEKDKES